MAGGCRRSNKDDDDDDDNGAAADKNCFRAANEECKTRDDRTIKEDADLLNMMINDTPQQSFSKTFRE